MQWFREDKNLAERTWRMGGSHGSGRCNEKQWPSYRAQHSGNHSCRKSDCIEFRLFNSKPIPVSKLFTSFNSITYPFLVNNCRCSDVSSNTLNFRLCSKFNLYTIKKFRLHVWIARTYYYDTGHNNIIHLHLRSGIHSNVLGRVNLTNIMEKIWLLIADLRKNRKSSANLPRQRLESWGLRHELDV